MPTPSALSLLLAGALLIPDGAAPAPAPPGPDAPAAPAPAAPTATAAPSPAPAPLGEDDAVVIVNGEPLTKRAYKETLFEQFGDGYLDVVINEMLLFARAKKEGIIPAPADLDAWIDEQVRQASGIEEIAGQDMNELRRQYRRHARTGCTLERLVKRARVSEEGMRREYELRYGEKRRARHILIQPEGADGPAEPLPEHVEAAKKKAADLFQKLKQGADFAALAKAESQDPASARNGGELPEFGRNEVVREFADVAFALKENEISEPVKSEYGYHVIQITKVVPPAKPFDDAVKAELRAEAERRPVDREELGRYLESLRKDAKIERKIP
jgi:hypothetical protein